MDLRMGRSVEGGLGSAMVFGGLFDPLSFLIAIFMNLVRP